VTILEAVPLEAVNPEPAPYLTACARKCNNTPSLETNPYLR
jgi:hypothetical protein